MSEQSGFDDFLQMQDDGQDDDLYSVEPESTQQEEQKELSPKEEWEKTRRAEIDASDEAEREAINELRAKGTKSVEEFNAKLKDLQEKRMQHNQEVDKEIIEDINSTAYKEWEKVVSLIDFNRSDLHEKDCAKMKSILLQLKH